MELGLGQRVIATRDLSFGMFTKVRQGMQGTIIDITGFFKNKCVVRWDDGHVGEVTPDLIAPVGR